MYRTMMRSKIHRARVTAANLDYIGSVTIDRDLMDAAGLIENEKVQIVNINNGERFETYVIEGGRGSGDICLNGACSRLAAIGDLVIIIAYGLIAENDLDKFVPNIVFVDDRNRMTARENQETAHTAR